MSERTGKCMCGVVSFTAQSKSEQFSTCYCKICQRWGGGPFRALGVEPDTMHIKGRANIGTIRTSDFAERAFCKRCGSSIWFRLTAGKYAGNTNISLGLLDDTDGLTLKCEYFSDYKNNTDLIPADCPQLTAADVDKIIAEFVTKDSQ